MFGALRESWQFLRRAPPGERFVRYHARRRQRRQHAWLGLLRLTAGVALVVIGLALLVAPGPGTLIAAAGAAVVAGESHGCAAFLDRCERSIRRLLERRRR